MRTIWNDQKTEDCLKYWNQGYSASQVARLLGGGISRNAVIGKIFRMGQGPADRVVKRKPTHKKLMERRKRIRASKPVAHRSGTHAMRWGKTHSIAPVEPAPLPPEPPTPETLVSFADLEPGMCKFIFGDPKQSGHGFCGCKTVANAAYCPGHHALCANAVQPVLRSRGSMGHLPSGNWAVINADRELEEISRA